MEWTLTDAALFKGVDVSAVGAVSDTLRPVEYLAGHTFYTQGETGERLFIIVSDKSNCAGAHRMAGRVCSLCWGPQRSITRRHRSGAHRSVLMTGL